MVSSSEKALGAALISVVTGPGTPQQPRCLWEKHRAAGSSSTAQPAFHTRGLPVSPEVSGGEQSTGLLLFAPANLCPRFSTHRGSAFLGLAAATRRGAVGTAWAEAVGVSAAPGAYGAVGGRVCFVDGVVG